MKIFLETNILLDLLVAARPSADASATVMDEIVKSRIDIYVTTQSIVDIYYIARSYSVSKAEIDNLSLWLLNHTNVRSLDLFDLKLALEDPHPDFEDNAQIARAEDQRCDVFLTSDKKILSRDIDSMLVMTPEQFVERMRSA